MTNDHVQDHLDRLADDIASAMPPNLLGAARTARGRRTRRRLVLATGVAAAAVVVVPLTSTFGLRDTGSSPAGTASQTTSTDPKTSTDPATATQVPESQLVTDRDDVLGEWTVTAVNGGPVPSDAIRGVAIIKRGAAGLSFVYTDGVNTHSVNRTMKPDGALVSRSVESTLVGCYNLEGAPCGQPAGLGVDEATELRVTPDGDLVLDDKFQGVSVVVGGQ